MLFAELRDLAWDTSSCKVVEAAHALWSFNHHCAILENHVSALSGNYRCRAHLLAMEPILAAIGTIALVASGLQA
jgi:hypothetical protein